MENMHNLD